MRRVGLFALLSLLTLAGTAEAQPRPAPGPGGQNADNSQFDLHRNETSTGEGEAARAKAQAGDCAGALAAFDDAIAHSDDPTLRRDRGLCHEKLGNIYPALDDLRAYVAARPGAPDAAAIRQKVDVLQAKTSNDNELLESTDRGKMTAASEDSVDVYEHANKNDRHKDQIGPTSGPGGHPYEYYVEQERLDDEAHKSSLRLGSGLVLGGWAQFPRLYFLGNLAKGGFGYAAGASLRYSGSKTWTGWFDFGWAGIGAFRNQPTYMTLRDGPLLALGAEARLGGGRKGNQFILRLGAGYERYVDTTNKAYANTVTGRFALGYRHIFGPSFGLELLVDGGPAVAIAEGGDANAGGIVGFHIGFDFGL